MGHKIFLIYGASGSGKSTLLSYLNEIGIKYSIHQKDTTRPIRPKEDPKKVPELRFISKKEFEDNFKQKKYVFAYTFSKNFYGIRKDLIEKAKKRNEFHFIIVGSFGTLLTFKNKFPNTVYIYVHYEPSDVKRFKERDTLEFSKRKKRIKRQFKDFVNNNTLFDHIIVTFSEKEYAKKQFKNILNLYA